MGTVAAAPAAMAAPKATAEPTTIVFPGSSWGVKAGPTAVGPGPNFFSDDPENVWVDAAGQLHLRITYRDGQWRAAEVLLDRSLGYGTYRFNLASPVGNLDPNVVLGLFTWSDNPAYNNREIDIEIARWGSATAATNAGYAVQPADRARNTHRYLQPDTAPTSQEFTWEPNRVSFRSATDTGATIASWKYTGSDVPRSGDERTRINLWLDGGRAPLSGTGVEVVLSSFTFTPR
ncbi:MAG: hypothetical protein ACR2HM_04870 [Acidimicrobiales bacterium]